MRFSKNSDLSSDEYVRLIVNAMAKRFTPSETVRLAIVERVILTVIHDPELVSGDPYHDLFPIVRDVSLDHFGIGDLINRRTRAKRKGLPGYMEKGEFKSLIPHQTSASD
ncbi:hypothetical protein [Agrobacterium salinitolerans]|uniref:hypothetical protein n=1 Tax=Agrobacterium salinitolerans TaxID=1183413 RepID=UPI0022B82AE2|nr:hypothetical protein [Agrobacterium salinitolerans]MCZ7886063.1 hypothetical protein [Agrobacterium salinitolerans]